MKTTSKFMTQFRDVKNNFILVDNSIKELYKMFYVLDKF
jgi:hypothetical protein